MSTEHVYTNFLNAANALVDSEKYEYWYEQSLKQPEIFWGEQAKHFLTWFKPWEKVLTGHLSEQNVMWFSGATLNAAYNCLDRQLARHAHEVAIIWESDDGSISTVLTYQMLYEKVCQFANVLKHYGIGKGDSVCIYLPMIPEAVIAMLACARIGAVHSVIFGGFSSHALETRINDAACRLVITANEGVRGNKIIPLKENVDTALANCPQVKQVIVVKRTEHTVSWKAARDIWYHEIMQQVSRDCAAVEMAANDALFVLYTSGSTGKPKGILHATAGYLLHSAMSFQLIFNYQPSEIFWCTADVGWITGHSYVVYGPLANAATILIYEGVPNFPTPSRYWQIIDKHKVNILYTAPTAIRALRKEGDSWVKAYQRKSLRILGSVGEPINPDAWEWYFDVVGDKRCPIVDTWWQTETGGIMISPLPYATPLKPGAATKPFFGVDAKIVDDEGKELTHGETGKLIITQPWPGMLKTIYKNQARYIEEYFSEVPGAYFTGDEAFRDETGNFWILGRNDDVMKVSGHRIGSTEIENTLVSHDAVSEAAAIAIPDDIKGQRIFVFVTLKKGMQASDDLKQELIQTVRQEVGAFAAPSAIHWVESLPKTRSGKIMRRLLRKIANHDVNNLGDLTTLADPLDIQQLIAENNMGINHEN